MFSTRLNRFRILCCAWAVAFVLAVGVACAEDGYVLGMSAAFTGPSGGIGIELYRGSAAAFAVRNERGGINGRPILLRTLDDGYQPDPAITNTIQLLQKHKAICLFDYVGTPTVTRVLPLLKGAHGRRQVMFFPFSGAEPQREEPYANYVFNLRASYRQELSGLVNQFVALGRKRLAVFYQADAYGRSGWDGTRRALEPYGLTLAGEATYHRGARFEDSMRKQVEIIKRTKPDAVISVGSYAACAAFIRDARDMGLDVPIANLSFVGCENMLFLLEEEGRRHDRDYTRNLVNTQVVPSYEDLSLPAVREYREVMNRTAPTLPEGADPDYVPLRCSFTGFEGFLNAKVMIRILENLEASPSLGLTEAAESIRQLDIGIDMPVSFGPDKHQGLDKVYFTHVRGGAFVPMLEEHWEAWRK